MAYSTNLFEDSQVLELAISGDLGDLLKDKSDDPSYYPVKLSYTEDGNEYEFPINAKTRGNFRRLIGRCKYLPLWLNFEDKSSEDFGIFKGQTKLKLTVPCKGEKYVLREWMAYRILNILTPMSFRVRLVKIILIDDNKVKDEPFYAFLLESEEELAARNKCIPVEHKLKPQSLPKESFIRVTVFEYMIGNTDWSVEFMHNIKYIANDESGIPYPVPYDFDHSGLVSAPYAKPVNALGIRSVKERLYRGYCQDDLDSFLPIIQEFLVGKNAIYNLYNENPVLDKKEKEFSIKYLDSFYKIFEKDEKWRKYFSLPCDPNGPGKIIVSGINQD